jgi:hypothetical protein
LNRESKNNKWFFEGGFEAKLLHTMSEHFNFTYEVLFCNNEWRIQLPNKTWNGIMGKITSKVCFKNKYQLNTLVEE